MARSTNSMNGGNGNGLHLDAHQYRDGWTAQANTGALDRLDAAETASMPARVLRERARAYAGGVADPDVGSRTEVLLVGIGAERYAIETRLLRSVHSARHLTPVPSVPPHVAGILNVRGEVVSVLNLAVAVGQNGGSAEPHNSRVLLAETSGGLVGLLVDDVIEVRELRVDSLDRPLSSHEFIHGVAEASVVFLDLENLLANPSLEVLGGEDLDIGRGQHGRT